jgi:hypothetical protein
MGFLLINHAGLSLKWYNISKKEIWVNYMKFYIASTLQNIDLVRIATYLFKQNDFYHTYDWTLNEQASTFEDMRFISDAQREGISDADFIVVILPGDKGTHVEIGMSLASKKRIYLYSPDEDIYDLERATSFYFLSEIRPFVGQFSDFISFVIKSENNLILLH